jgi:hypothetical protein
MIKLPYQTLTMYTEPQFGLVGTPHITEIILTKLLRYGMKLTVLCMPKKFSQKTLLSFVKCFTDHPENDIGLQSFLPIPKE